VYGIEAHKPKQIVPRYAEKKLTGKSQGGCTRYYAVDVAIDVRFMGDFPAPLLVFQHQ